MGLVGGVRGRERGDAKSMLFDGQEVYLHYFKNIRQGHYGRAGKAS